MLKKLFIFFCILCIAALAAIYFFGSKLISTGIQKGVVTLGPSITQTTVELDSVDLSLLSGKCTLKGLAIGNPEGYRDANLFYLGQIDIDLDLQSLTSDKIIINKIHILQPEISYEQELTSSNVKKLINNVNEFTKSEESSAKPAATEEPAQEDAASKQVVIKDLVIDEGKIYASLLGAGLELPLMKIEMQNIGEGETSYAEVLNEVLMEVLNVIGPAIKDSTKSLGDIGNITDLENITTGNESIDSAVKGIKNLFGK